MVAGTHSKGEDMKVAQIRTYPSCFKGFGLALLALSLVLTACGLGGNEGPPPLYPDSGVGVDPGGNDPVVVRPILQATDSQGRICTDKGAVVGRAQPGSTVVARGPGGLGYGKASSTDGRFCVAVPLAKGAANRIEAFSEHPTHGTSQVSVLTLTHAGSSCPQQAAVTPASTEPSTVHNRAKITQIRSNGEVQEGTFETALIDGDTHTDVHYVGGGWFQDDAIYLWLTLDKVSVISKVVIHWGDKKGSGTRYGTHYFVGVSAAAEPGSAPHSPEAPTPFRFVDGIMTTVDGWISGGDDHGAGHSDWTYLVDVRSADGGQDEVDLLASQPVAQHIALRIEADGHASVWEEYLIAEIEVHTVQLQGGGQYLPPTNTEQVCSGAF